MSLLVGAASKRVVITPKQAAESIADDAQGVITLSTVIEALIDGALVRRGRAVVSSRLVPGALLAAAEVVRELERRYRRAGWSTFLDGTTLTITRPPLVSM